MPAFEKVRFQLLDTFSFQLSSLAKCPIRKMRVLAKMTFRRWTAKYILIISICLSNFSFKFAFQSLIDIAPPPLTIAKESIKSYHSLHTYFDHGLLRLSNQVIGLTTLWRWLAGESHILKILIVFVLYLCFSLGRHERGTCSYDLYTLSTLHVPVHYYTTPDTMHMKRLHERYYQWCH